MHAYCENFARNWHKWFFNNIDICAFIYMEYVDMWFHVDCRCSPAFVCINSSNFDVSICVSTRNSRYSLRETYIAISILVFCSCLHNRTIGILLKLWMVFLCLVLVTKSITTWMVHRQIGTELTDYTHTHSDLIILSMVFSLSITKNLLNCSIWKFFRSSEIVFNSWTIFFLYILDHIAFENTHCTTLNTMYWNVPLMLQNERQDNSKLCKWTMDQKY